MRSKSGCVGGVLLAIVLIVGLVLAFACTKKIPAGYVGVVYNTDAAVDLVTRTISGLEVVNKEINDTVAEIDSYTAQLTQTREQLSKNRRHNAAVIANFTKLLATDEDDAPSAGEAEEDKESA